MLTSSGREATYGSWPCACAALGGEPDPRITEVCRVDGRTLVTLDLDFADIRTYPPADYQD